MVRKQARRQSAWQLTALAGLLGLGLGIGRSALALSSPCPPFARSQLDTSETTIILGSQPNQPYVAAVPGQSEVSLDRIKPCYAGAFMTTHHLGPYIHVDDFGSHAEAVPVVHWLRSLGLDARVIYRP